MKKLLIYLALITITYFQPVGVKPINAVGCPAGSSDYGTSVKCATSCSTSCTGPDNRCCALDSSAATGINGVTEPLTKSDLDQFNPLKQHSSKADALSTPGGIVSRFLGQFAFPIAGLILFVMLVWGGFEMLSGAATQKSIDAGKQRITAALIGFLILFAVYWIAQIVEVMFGVQIL